MKFYHKPAQIAFPDPLPPKIKKTENLLTGKELLSQLSLLQYLTCTIAANTIPLNDVECPESVERITEYAFIDAKEILRTLNELHGV